MGALEFGGLNVTSKAKDSYDVIIVGGGPGGLTAAIYAVQGGLSPLVVEKAVEGGQMNNTETIENWPGIKSISGSELSEMMTEHAKHFGVDLLSAEVTSIITETDPKAVLLETGRKISAGVIVIATGANPKKLSVPGEDDFTGRGVSYCATCDGHFFANKHVAVVGGGNSAMAETLYLLKIVRKITVVQDLPKLTADKMLKDRVMASGKVDFLLGATVKEIRGEDKLENLLVSKAGKVEDISIDVDGVFVFIGTTPNSRFLAGVVELNRHGYVVTDRKMQTSVPGVYAIGDVIEKEVRQITTAAGDAAIAVHHAILDHFD